MQWANLRKRHQWRLMEKVLKVKCFLLVIYFCLNVRFPHIEAIKRVLSLPMRHSNIDVLYVLTGLKKNRTRMLKSLPNFRKDSSRWCKCICTYIIDKYENPPDNLQSMWLADFVSSYASKKADDLPIEPDETKAALFQYLILMMLGLIQK